MAEHQQIDNIKRYADDPLTSIPTLTGVLNRAFEPTPSTVPVVPPRPAKVVTAPEEITTMRMRLFFQSATTKRDPALFIASPEGEKKVATVPMPSVKPVSPAFPASRVTVPVDRTIRRKRLLR